MGGLLNKGSEEDPEGERGSTWEKRPARGIRTWNQQERSRKRSNTEDKESAKCIASLCFTERRLRALLSFWIRKTGLLSRKKPAATTPASELLHPEDVLHTSRNKHPDSEFVSPTSTVCMGGPLKGVVEKDIKGISRVDQDSDQEGKEQPERGARTGKPARRAHKKKQLRGNLASGFGRRVNDIRKRRLLSMRTVAEEQPEGQKYCAAQTNGVTVTGRSGVNVYNEGMEVVNGLSQ